MPSKVLRLREGPEQEKVSRRKGADLTGNIWQPTEGKELAEVPHWPGRPPPNTRDVRGPASPARAACAVCAMARVQACSHTGRDFLARQSGQLSSWPPAFPPPLQELPPLSLCLTHTHTPSSSHTYTHTCTRTHICTEVQEHNTGTQSPCDVEGSSTLGTKDGTRDPCLANPGTKFPKAQR